MLSRVAENVYWMARYLERAEATARLLNANSTLLLDLPRKFSPGWEPLLLISGGGDEFRKLYRAPDERSILRFLIADTKHSGSIFAALGIARENARAVRDFLPREAWERINDLYLYAKANLTLALSRNGRFEYLSRVVFGEQQISGLLASTMSHDHGYDFLVVGRNLERADMTSRIVDVRSAGLLGERAELAIHDNLQWMSLLRSLSGYQMYRRFMQVRVRRDEVIRFLFQNREFPRAFAHCVETVEAALRHLPRSQPPLREASNAKRLAIESEPGAMSQEELHDFIDELQLALIALDREIVATYFRNEPLSLAKASPAQAFWSMAQ